jgi:hypothetical protein
LLSQPVVKSEPLGSTTVGVYEKKEEDDDAKRPMDVPAEDWKVDRKRRKKERAKQEKREKEEARKVKTEAELKQEID